MTKVCCPMSPGGSAQLLELRVRVILSQLVKTYEAGRVGFKRGNFLCLLEFQK